jgi:trans-aconitate 2-methyltransferase
LATQTFPDRWDPERYGRFAAERAAPFEDLLRLLEPVPGPRLLDVGCGTGELTARAHDLLEASESVGIDPSPAMLARTGAAAGPRPGLRFERGSAEHVPDGPWDVILSNAALHWAPEHERLLGRLADQLAPRGQLAFQVPVNDHHPSHAVAREVAGEPPFRDLLGGYSRQSPVLEPERYAALLLARGFVRQRVRAEVYLHVLPARDDVTEWVRGSVLTAYEERLSPRDWERFLDRYRERLAELLPDARPFPYTYRRLFVWGRLPDPPG